MKKVVIFTNNKLINYKLNIVFTKDKYDLCFFDCTIDEAITKIFNLSCDIVVVSSTFMQGRSQFLDVLVNTKKFFVIYISQNIERGILYNVYNEINFLAVKEEDIQSLLSILDYAFKALSRIKILSDKNRSLESEIVEVENLRLAKLILMKQGYTEPEAHKYITKKAMELRKTKGQVAKMIRERVI